jgi:lipoate-protein ligase B
VPCGIADCKATSLEKLLGHSVKREEIAPRIAKHLGGVFGLELKETPRAELLEKLQEVKQPVTASA